MGILSTRRYVQAAAGVSIFCGFLQALPALGTPAQGALLSAARGIAAARGLEGYGAPGIGGRINGWLWTLGGPGYVAAGQWAAAFLFGAAFSFGILLAAGAAARILRGKRSKACVIGGAVAVVLAACVVPVRDGLFRRAERINRLDLAVPSEVSAAVAAYPKTKVFANASALPYLLLFAPEAAGGISPAAAAGLAGNPPAWRDALRRSGWTAAILSGPIEEYQPLLDHLATSPDWHLKAITNQGCLFLRTPDAAAPSIDAGEFHLGNNKDTAVYLAQIAGYYDAIHRPTVARACIDQALQRAPNNTAVLAHAATFAVAHKRWQEAIAFANKTLAKEPGNPHASLVKALALLETGQAGKALVQVNNVLAKAPDDLYSLFLKARICRTLNDYVNEAETLERVIAVNERAGMPTVNYRIFLGQAYARQGQAGPALDNYRKVLASGKLNAEQAEEIQDAIATIEAKTRP